MMLYKIVHEGQGHYRVECHTAHGINVREPISGLPEAMTLAFGTAAKMSLMTRQGGVDVILPDGRTFTVTTTIKPSGG